jgi:hypothetical protein
MQKILEKFEFFPIKCRVQRATEMFARFFSQKSDVHTGYEDMLAEQKHSLNSNTDDENEGIFSTKARIPA